MSDEKDNENGEKKGRELRRRRSEETHQAMTYQLEYVVEEQGMDLMFLADASGILITYAGDESVAELFAAHAPAIAAGLELDDELFVAIPGLEPENILCESISLDDIPMYLGAVMDPHPDHARAFERARTGIQRIYYTTSELAGKKDD